MCSSERRMKIHKVMWPTQKTDLKTLFYRIYLNKDVMSINAAFLLILEHINENKHDSYLNLYISKSGTYVHKSLHHEEL